MYITYKCVLPTFMDFFLPICNIYTYTVFFPIEKQCSYSAYIKKTSKQVLV